MIEAYQEIAHAERAFPIVNMSQVRRCCRQLSRLMYMFLSAVLGQSIWNGELIIVLLSARPQPVMSGHKQ